VADSLVSFVCIDTRRLRQRGCECFGVVFTSGAVRISIGVRSRFCLFVFSRPCFHRGVFIAAASISASRGASSRRIHVCIKHRVFSCMYVVVVVSLSARARLPPEAEGAEVGTAASSTGRGGGA
jgi:hypothetical protein